MPHAGAKLQESLGNLDFFFFLNRRDVCMLSAVCIIIFVYLIRWKFVYLLGSSAEAHSRAQRGILHTREEKEKDGCVHVPMSLAG